MLRLFIGTILFTACIIVGRHYKQDLCKKRDFFIALQSFAVYLKREISFSYTTVGNVIGLFNCNNSDLKRMLGLYLEGVLQPPDYLSVDEQNFIKNFFDKIGKSNLDNELFMIETFIREAEVYKNTEISKCVKSSKIYTKLSLCFGVICFVAVL